MEHLQRNVISHSYQKKMSLVLAEAWMKQKFRMTYLWSSNCLQNQLVLIQQLMVLHQQRLKKQIEEAVPVKVEEKVEEKVKEKDEPPFETNDKPAEQPVVNDEPQTVEEIVEQPSEPEKPKVEMTNEEKIAAIRAKLAAMQGKK